LAIRKTNQRHFPLNYISILFFFLKKVYWWCTFKIFGTFSNLSKYHLYPYWACKKQSYLRSKHVKFILVVFKIRSLNCIWKDVMKSLFFFFLAVLGFELRASSLLGRHSYHHLTIPFALFLWWIFWDRVSWTICVSWLGTVILLTSASWVARIAGVSHWCLWKVYFHVWQEEKKMSKMLLLNNCTIFWQY
jgi:hypothetical protein